MVNSKSYEVVMISGDDSKLFCCENAKCSIEIGAEVQALTINSTENSITSGSFKVVYVGVQSSSLWIKPIFGPRFDEVGSFMGLKTIAVGDYIRITTTVYLVSAFNNSKIKQLQPQRKIMVFFSNDQIYYTFEVLSSSNSVILVSNYN